MRCFLLALTICSLLGCLGTPVIDPHRSPLATFDASNNFDARKAQLIVLHHTNMASFAQALETLKTRNPHGRVSAHYLIAATGEIVQLVAEDQRAWHAGVSRWAGRSDLNSASIGIELDNDGFSPFPPAQIAALMQLLEDICARSGIERRQIWGHSDIAPARKDDPNKYFPWAQLAAQGFGLWPRKDLSAPPKSFDPWQALALIGYDLNDRPAALAAFHRHYFGHEARELQPEDLPVLADLQAQLGVSPWVP